MNRYWANFAKHKNPNGEGLPLWKPYAADDKENMIFQDTPVCKPVNENPLQAFVKKVMLES